MKFAAIFLLVAAGAILSAGPASAFPFSKKSSKLIGQKSTTTTTTTTTPASAASVQNRDGFYAQDSEAPVHASFAVGSSYEAAPPSYVGSYEAAPAPYQPAPAPYQPAPAPYQPAPAAYPAPTGYEPALAEQPESEESTYDQPAPAAAYPSEPVAQESAPYGQPAPVESTPGQQGYYYYYYPVKATKTKLKLPKLPSLSSLRIPSYSKQGTDSGSSIFSIGMAAIGTALLSGLVILSLPVVGLTGRSESGSSLSSHVAQLLSEDNLATLADFVQHAIETYSHQQQLPL